MFILKIKNMCQKMDIYMRMESFIVLQICIVVIIKWLRVVIQDGVNMICVKVFDESYEKDLEDVVNVFLKKIDDSNFVDIKY